MNTYSCDGRSNILVTHQQIYSDKIHRPSRYFLLTAALPVSDFRPLVLATQRQNKASSVILKLARFLGTATAAYREWSPLLFSNVRMNVKTTCRLMGIACFQNKCSVIISLGYGTFSGSCQEYAGTTYYGTCSEPDIYHYK